jgi:hypothetical protein
MNKYHLSVMGELKRSPYFFKQNNLLRYLIPSESENINNNEVGRKVMAVWDLRDWGAFEITNSGEALIPDRYKLKYEFYLKVVHQVFDDVYQKCVKEVEKSGVSEYENQLLITQNLPMLKLKLKEVIFKNKIRGKYQIALINELSNFKPQNTKDLNNRVGAKFLEGVKCELRKKLRKSGFDIKGERGKDITQTGWYQLTFEI